MATGQQSGVLVVDLDGEAGQASLASLMNQRSWTPVTASVKTGKGLHLYFRYPDEPVRTRTAVMPGLDVRGEGGYVIAPPSRHASGSVYVWHREDEPLGTAPEWLVDLINGRSAASTQSVQTARAEDTEIIPVGARNDTLFKRASSMRENGLDVDEIVEELTVMNENACEEPLPQDEVREIAESAAKYPKGRTPSSRGKGESLLRYFPFNVVEWMTDEAIVMMTDAQRGRYIVSVS